MTPIAEMSLDDLNKVLTASKWTLGILAILTAIAGVFNQWVSDRIAKLQSAAKTQAQARLEVSEAELKQTKEKTAKLEARLAPRSLSEGEWLSVSQELVAFHGTQFQFVSYQDDAEVRGLVIQMIKALIKAGWRGQPAKDFLMASLVEGVVVEYASAREADLGPAADALATALRRHKIAAVASRSGDLASNPDTLRIKVGKKHSDAP